MARRKRRFYRQVVRNCRPHSPRMHPAHTEPAWEAPPPDTLDDFTAEADTADVWEDGDLLETTVEDADTDIAVVNVAAPDISRCRSLGSRYPVWERRLRLTAETRLDMAASGCPPSIRIVPVRVVFTSPPTLEREIIVCGSVLARVSLRGVAVRRIALPFQSVITAWPVRNKDRVDAEFICFAGTRVCPVLVTAPNGRTRRACDIKVAFDARVRVFHLFTPWRAPRHPDLW